MTKRVLVADCDPISQEIYTALLPQLGAEPHFATDDETAVRRLLELGPEVLLVDVLLPRQGGLALLQRIRGLRDGAEVPVIVTGQVAQDRAFRKEAIGALAALDYVKKPFTLDVLRERLTQALVGSAATAAPFANPFAAPLPEQDGVLEAAPSPQLFQRLSLRRATGCLTITRGRQRKVLYLRDGAVTFALSNQLRETLSSHLVGRGRIDEATVRAGLQEMRGGGTRLGEFLIANGLLAPEEVFAAIRDNVREKILDVFRWEQGTYRVTPYREPPAPLPGAAFPMSEVLWRGVREVVPRARVDTELEALGVGVLRSGPESSEPPTALFLTGEDLRVLRTLRRGLGGTVEELLGQGSGELHRRLLYYLLLSGYFTLEEGAREGRGEGAFEGRGAADRQRLLDLRRRNYFQVLQVPLDADDRAVRDAYRNSAKQVHPDTLGPDDPPELHRLYADTFQVIRAAYDGLKTPAQRQQYRRRLYGEKLDDPVAEGNAVLQAEVHYQDGQRLVKRREWDRAAELLARAWELNPEEGEYALALGTARARQVEAGRPHLEREAEALLRRAHGMLAHSAEPAYQMGRLALRRNDTDTAASQFRLALERDPDHLPAQREFRLLRMRQPAGAGRLGDLLSRRAKD